MTLCLDANVVIDIVRRGDPVVRSAWNRVSSTERTLVLSSVVLHELETGVALSDRPDIQRERLSVVMRRCAQPAFDAEDAKAAGQLRARLQRDGTPIGTLDTLIAGQALARKWTLVTRNLRHFGRVPGLILIDWSRGLDPLSEDQIAQAIASG